MSTTELTRQDIGPPPRTTLKARFSPAFSDELVNLTGYRGHVEHFELTNGDSARSVSSYEIISYIAQEFGWRPFTTESVRSYKDKQLLETRLSWAKTLRSARWVPIFLASCIVSAIFSVAVWAVAAITFWLFSVGVSSSIIAAGTMIVLFGALTVSLVISERYQKWHLVPINEYGPPIPETALIRMMQIKRRFGQTVSFSVDHLTGAGYKSLLSDEAKAKGAYERWLREDPFLVMHITHSDGSSEDHYIAVWDEPSFEAEIA